MFITLLLSSWLQLRSELAQRLTHLDSSDANPFMTTIEEHYA